MLVIGGSELRAGKSLARNTLAPPQATGFYLGLRNVQGKLVPFWNENVLRWRSARTGLRSRVLISEFGIVGARAYHVLTHWGDYVAPGVNPWSALFIWEGGIAMFGSLMGGALGAWFACRRTGVRLLSFLPIDWLL